MQISNIIGGGGNRDQYALFTFFKFRFVRYTPKEGDSMQTNYFRRCACDTAQLNHVQYNVLQQYIGIALNEKKNITLAS